MKTVIPVIDLFAGPGGLGEGFSAYQEPSGDTNPFRIGLSIEKESSAVRTLKLRAFFRQFPHGQAPEAYYQFLNGELGSGPEEELYLIPGLRREVAAADREAQQLTLGEDNRKINKAIKEALGNNLRNWVLIGGPPCQAYSLVGRSRNKGNKNYEAKEDHRNFLYREYLKVISRFRPAVFVMENVKGLLSAKIEGNPIINDILSDLQCPARALKTKDARTGYQVFSLVVDPAQAEGQQNLFQDLEPRDYLIRSEEHGIPQARHRIILLGIREDILTGNHPGILQQSESPTIKQVIGDLPKLRSGLSKSPDSLSEWKNAVTGNDRAVLESVRSMEMGPVAVELEKAFEKIRNSRLSRSPRPGPASLSNLSKTHPSLADWFLDSRLQTVCNHETRGHIPTDLQRYLFCSCYGKAAKTGERGTPKADDFPDILAPAHANWKSGHFADRFRVQSEHRFGTTVTSHISKDGHYFIHYDPAQCRSLTVREAARIQTFPDNYFFVGNRTQQYVQVGNAVPPFLARQIAEIVFSLLG